MATYSSYKKLLTDNLSDNVVTSDKLVWNARPKTTVQWIYNERALACGGQCSNAGGCVEQANGKCCLWTVPTGVTRVNFEIWSGGGGGAGMICCNYCSFSIGGSGGNYASKSIVTAPGCQYTICAGGAWPCSKAHTCAAGMGCASWIQGFNLSNFCVVGGCGGWMCDGDAWGTYCLNSGCANCNICGFFGADFGIMGSSGFKGGHSGCHCSGSDSWSGAAPMIGLIHATSATESWCSCGCYVNWPAGGGASGTSSYCDNWAKNCAGGAGQGGSGVVKITYA
jgi:hypothetical protein